MRESKTETKNNNKKGTNLARFHIPNTLYDPTPMLLSGMF